jgi:hypothetical protein
MVLNNIQFLKCEYIRLLPVSIGLMLLLVVVVHSNVSLKFAEYETSKTIQESQHSQQCNLQSACLKYSSQ